MGYGAYNTNPIAPVASLEVNPGVVTGGLPTSFTESYISANSKEPSTSNELNNAIPTSRTLFNILNTGAVRASTAGLLNWICDANPATSGGASGSTQFSSGGLVQKGTNHTAGGNYDANLSSIIQGNYGFVRLTDATPELTVAKQTSGNGVVNPNASCDARATITGITTGSTTVTLGTSALPSNIQVGWEVATAPGYLQNIPYPAANGSGVTTTNPTTITLIGNGSNGLAVGQIQLSSAVVAGSGSVAPTTLYFPGHPPVLSVTDPNS